MAYFPVFVDIESKKCVVIGGGHTSLRKVRTLMQFKANVVVVSPLFKREFDSLRSEPLLELVVGQYDRSCLEGAFIAIAATDDRDVNSAVYRDATEMGVLVNVVDVPHQCDFYFPAIIRRGDTVIGVSTSGGCPSLAGRLRHRIDEMLPEAYEEVTHMMSSARKKIREISDDEEMRKLIFERLFDELEKFEVEGAIDDFVTEFDDVFAAIVDEIPAL